MLRIRRPCVGQIGALFPSMLKRSALHARSAIGGLMLPQFDKLRLISVLSEIVSFGAMLTRGIVLVAALIAFEFGSSQPAGATELGSFFWVEPPTVQVEDRPKPLYAPYGYYGPQGGCSRRPVWQGRRWKSAIVCLR